jgi:hypothetical protein
MLLSLAISGVIQFNSSFFLIISFEWNRSIGTNLIGIWGIAQFDRRPKANQELVFI